MNESELAQIEADANKMKAELHVRVHLLKLVTEVRRLGRSGTTRPSVDDARTALSFLNYTETVAARQPVDTDTVAVHKAALAVLARYFT